VKFGFPVAFAITQLAWGGLEFAGGYLQAEETINLFKAIKWGTDYFVKAHSEANVLYGMVRMLRVTIVLCLWENKLLLSSQSLQCMMRQIADESWQSRLT